LRHDNFIPPLTAIKSRGRLPHWQADNSTYFLTFRLRDSLPAEVTRGLLAEREHLARMCSTAVERARLDTGFALRLDRELDSGYGSCLLREHGRVVANALRHFDGERYALHAWCVMPNHVHVMLHVLRGADVPKIVHSWKSFTAHEIRLGVIWQREYFDRIVRSPEDYMRTREYIRANPVRAGLKDWPWVG
jgi:REP element-mobilizing transposase RayT